jgi:hypothetical protein
MGRLFEEHALLLRRSPALKQERLLGLDLNQSSFFSNGAGPQKMFEGCSPHCGQRILSTDSATT